MNHIDFYWGKCIRWINLNNGKNGDYNEYNDYKVGNIVTWIQFSSSSKADSNADIECFENRNTKFIIWSIKGRDIS